MSTAAWQVYPSAMTPSGKSETGLWSIQWPGSTRRNSQVSLLWRGRELETFEDSHLLSAPANLRLEETAAVPYYGGTAINALFFGPTPLKPGMKILTQGTVISTSSSDAKLVTAKRLEATHAVDYSTHPDWDDGVLSLTGGKRVDHVLEVGDSTKEINLTATILLGGKTPRGVFGFNKIHEEMLINFVDKFVLKPEVAKTV
ncbi:unnamed protein product [Diplocarpon coronariae]